MTAMPVVSGENPGRSPSNRSLERGVEILRAFRPGSELLGNADLAERTGLPRSTVSRLTQTLVRTGMLEHSAGARAYRLAPAVLSLAHAMRTGSSLLRVAAPLMRGLAEERRINVGLAAADRDEMVYLESVRYARRASLRTVVSGQRVPLELTSLGRAWLAAAAEPERRRLLSMFRKKWAAQWPALYREIGEAIESVGRHGYCVASWQPEVVALATPIRVADGVVHVVNVSVSSAERPEIVAADLADALLGLAARIVHAAELG